ncbi:MAG: hypothetical protein F9K16_09720 [Thermoanaerobaculia bacterium]|nr:MAG: hypothetical protein F9K16_09720 [Thermoanaerobaculia bacterium]
MRAPRPELSDPLASRASSERGSAYLFALLVLLVLTVIGLSLAVITQTEVQIGGAEKSAVRVLYGADTGVRMQFAAFATTNSAPMTRYDLDVADIAGATLTEIVDTAPYLPMYLGPCGLCSQNVGSDDRKFAINFVTNALGRRLGTVGSTDLPQASKLVSLMYFVQPQNEPVVDVALRTFDTSLVADDPDTEGLETIRY